MKDKRSDMCDKICSINMHVNYEKISMTNNHVRIATKFLAHLFEIIHTESKSDAYCFSGNSVALQMLDRHIIATQ